MSTRVVFGVGMLFRMIEGEIGHERCALAYARRKFDTLFNQLLN